MKLESIFEISEQKMKEHKIYAQILLNRNHLEKNFRLMDLENPLVDENEKEYIEGIIHGNPYDLDIANFVKFYHEDGIGKTIPNLTYWLSTNFVTLDNFNKSKK